MERKEEESRRAPTPLVTLEQSDPPARSHRPPSWAWRAATLVGVTVVLGLMVALLGDRTKADVEPRRWTFTEENVEVAELGLATPVISGGRWLLEDHAHATGGRALVNHAGDPSNGPALAVTRDVAAGATVFGNPARAKPQ